MRRPGAGEQPPNGEITLVTDDIDAAYAAALAAGCESLAEPATSPTANAWPGSGIRSGRLVELGNADVASL